MPDRLELIIYQLDPLDESGQGQDDRMETSDQAGSYHASLAFAPAPQEQSNSMNYHQSQQQQYQTCVLMRSATLIITFSGLFQYPGIQMHSE
jgi:hypothetical protein